MILPDYLIALGPGYTVRSFANNVDWSETSALDNDNWNVIDKVYGNQTLAFANLADKKRTLISAGRFTGDSAKDGSCDLWQASGEKIGISINSDQMFQTDGFVVNVLTQ